MGGSNDVDIDRAACGLPCRSNTALHRSWMLRTENKALRAWLMQADAEITDGLAREARPRAKTERPQ
jgi:hypothetical protein